MTAHVVDRLEAVDVDQSDGQGLADAPCSRKSAVELSPHASVGEARERVGVSMTIGPIQKPSLCALVIADARAHRLDGRGDDRRKSEEENPGSPSAGGIVRTAHQDQRNDEHQRHPGQQTPQLPTRPEEPKPRDGSNTIGATPEGPPAARSNATTTKYA